MPTTVRWRTCVLLLLLLLMLCGVGSLQAASPHGPALPQLSFPPPLESYGDSQVTSIREVLRNRVRRQPFNLAATLLFAAAVLHTFLTHRFVHWAHRVQLRHQLRMSTAGAADSKAGAICVSAHVLHFLGEVEAVFGIWVIPLAVLMTARLGWSQTLNYLERRVSYNEAVFVVVIMVMASTRPVLVVAENCVRLCARLGGGRPVAWWFSILTLGPVLGSVITEPAAMTICALLLGQRFYALNPPAPLAYGTLGLLFVNISVGGVLTHFAAPPVLMVAGPWGWDTPFMFRHFGSIAVMGIVLATLFYYMVLRRFFGRLIPPITDAALNQSTSRPVSAWVILGHLGFMAWTVFNAHHPILVLGGFLFFLAFYEVTTEYQTELQLRGPILVGFFLAGLVIHGGLQEWWIAPVLRRLHELPLLFAALALSAFNDNAAVTYLSTLVPNLHDALKFAVVAGAVTGGGLTVIANAPNPAGQSILSRFFPEGIAPLGLFLGALPATAILALSFILLMY